MPGEPGEPAVSPALAKPSVDGCAHRPDRRNSAAHPLPGPPRLPRSAHLGESTREVTRYIGQVGED
jgi:hypothetical protein